MLALVLLAVEERKRAQVAEWEEDCGGRARSTRWQWRSGCHAERGETMIRVGNGCGCWCWCWKFVLFSGNLEDRLGRCLVLMFLIKLRMPLQWADGQIDAPQGRRQLPGANPWPLHAKNHLRLLALGREVTYNKWRAASES